MKVTCTDFSKKSR